MTAKTQPSQSVWEYKPWWCQPWSILLTGITLIGGSWALLHRVWFTAIVAIPVLVWMVFFLGIYPRWVAESGLLADLDTQSPSPTDGADRPSLDSPDRDA